jgi:putative NADH-flavin reductase
MKLTIVAATGGIGRHLLDQALAAGHDVTAVVRDPAKLSREVPAVAVDMSAPDAAALEAAIGGADAVLSGLGPRSRADAGITAPGTRAIVAAMTSTGVRRVVVVSAAPVGTVPSPGRPNPPKHDPGDGPVMRYVLGPMITAILRAHYVDLAVMEDALRDSGLDWTSVRPPRLTDRPLTGTYRTAFERNVRGGLTVSRADVAHYMLHALDDPATIGHAVGIAR